MYIYNFRGGVIRKERRRRCFFRPSRSNREYSLVSRRATEAVRGRKMTAKFPFRSHKRRTEKAGRPASFCSFGQKGNQRRNYSHPNHERRSRIVPLNRVTNYYGTSVARLQSDQRPLNIILLDAGSGDLKRTDRERERERPT